MRSGDTLYVTRAFDGMPRRKPSCRESQGAASGHWTPYGSRVSAAVHGSAGAVTLRYILSRVGVKPSRS